jgi:NADPH:quinone reductase-like Zn-dependent oxidoreductase
MTPEACVTQTQKESKKIKTRSKKRLIEIHKHLAKLANQKLLQAKIAKKYSFEDYLLAYDHIDKTGSERDGKVILLPNH